MNIEDRNENDTLVDSPTHSNVKKVIKNRKNEVRKLFLRTQFNPKVFSKHVQSD